MKMLTDTNPAGRYWIKLDGADVKEALQHSVKDKWTDDVDVNDNKLQQLREEYESRVSFIKSCTSTQHSKQLAKNYERSLTKKIQTVRY